MPEASVTLDEFRGLFAVDEEDVIPPNHFKDALNLAYGPGYFSSRGGITAHLTIDDVRRVSVYNIPGEASRLLVLNGSGELFDSTFSLVTPILTIATMTDFSSVSMFGRAYISPHDGKVGLEDEVIYVYDANDGTNVARPAAGNPPTGFDLTLALVTPTASLTDIVAPVAPANGAQILTTSPFIPNVANTIKFTQTGGAVTAITITVVGIIGNSAATKIYVDKIFSAGPTTYVTGEIWQQITSITISGLAGAGGLFKVETTGVPGGKLEIGYHVIGVIYETISGFLTKPGPENNLSAIFVNRKNRAINVSGIPASPGAEIEKIHIVSSKFIPRRQYSGNADPQQYEMFFVPQSSGGVLEPGTTSTTINYFDADLLDSADYLLDNLSEIPASVTLYATSKGRLLSGGEFDNDRIIRGSKGGEPEAFSATDGFVIVDPGSGGVRNITEYRDSIYIYKSFANLITQDNGDVLTTWTINLIDRTIGTECHGLASIYGSAADVEDVVLVCDRAGLYAFNGGYSDKPLTWKIRAVWGPGVIDSDKFYKTQITVDPVGKAIFVVLQSDESDDPGGPDAVDIFLYGDYNDGLNWQDIKWSFWELYKADGLGFVPETLASILGDTDEGSKVMFGYRDATKVYKTSPDVANANNDDSNPITYRFETYKYTASDQGAVTHITAVRFKINGFGEMDLTLFGPNNEPEEAVNPIIMPTSSNGNIRLPLNFVQDDISIRGVMDALDERFQIAKIWLFGSELWQDKSGGFDFDLKYGLVAYWDLEEASGTRVDSLGINDLTDNNTVTQAVGPGGHGFAAQFTRANSEFLSHADDPSLRLGSYTDGYTIAFWMYIDSFASAINVLGKENTGALNREFNVKIDISTQRLFYRIFNAAGGSQLNIPLSAPNVGFVLSAVTWYFIALWWDPINSVFGAQVDDYLIRELPLTVTHNPGTTAQFQVGGLQADPTNCFDGRIARVGLWSRVLNRFEREFLINMPNGNIGRTFAQLNP